jgi:riboflavin biosynthesis pyrimidine reductase
MHYSDEALPEHSALRDRSRLWVRANFIASVDGAATHASHTRGLTNADDKRVLNPLRMLCDVVLAGAQTVAGAAPRGLWLGRVDRSARC